jgi:hypothetical protein
MNRITRMLFALSLFVIGACANQQTKDETKDVPEPDRATRQFEYRNPRL